MRNVLVMEIEWQSPDGFLYPSTLYLDGDDVAAEVMRANGVRVP